MHITKDLVYDPDHRLYTDYYDPEFSNNKILVFWHGGGWFRGDKDQLAEFASKAAEQGFKTFVPNYRLAPKFTYPSAHIDALTFISWLRSSPYYEKENEIVQIGASVGGTLALFLSMKYRFKTVAWSAPLNFKNWLVDHEDVIGAKDPTKELGLTSPEQIHASFYKYFTTTYLGPEITTEKITSLDLFTSFSGQIGETWLYNSKHELVPLRDAIKMQAIISKVTDASHLTIVSGNGHAMDYAEKFIQSSLDFLAKN